MSKSIKTKEIEQRIYLVRGQKVMLDSDLAELYGVTTGNLNKAVKRNVVRFPEEFMFQLNANEYKDLIFQIGTSSSWGGRRKSPYVFTEHGAVMLSSVLNSSIAVNASIQIVKAFVKIRNVIIENKELVQKLNELECQIQSHDKSIVTLFNAIKQLMIPPPVLPKHRIGFNSGNK